MDTLAPIPPDPVPTKLEIQAELGNQTSWERSLPRDLRLQFAEMGWLLRRRREDPDAFWRPFAPEYLRSP
jgi:hypothetical protein